jgi:MerR HTH family regulatory protein
MSDSTEDMTAADVFCMHHQIELSFIQSLHSFGLIAYEEVDNQIFLPQSQLNDLEKFVRMHYELDINMEGIETIYFLLQRNADLQMQINLLHAKLRIYEKANETIL